MNDFNYRRRHSSTVQIGNVPLGGDNPIRIQSMTSTSTLDTDASVAQCRRIFDAGADYVRLTAQGVREAHNIGEIRAALHAAGYTKPLVADIHFNPKAAFEAAATTDKVRINPGNFVDAARTFKKLEYTDEEYAAELEKIRRAVVPFLAICREHHTAVRLGVNHGSLSDRIMSRYGDTPAGMVESASPSYERLQLPPPSLLDSADRQRAAWRRQSDTDTVDDIDLDARHRRQRGAMPPHLRRRRRLCAPDRTRSARGAQYR